MLDHNWDPLWLRLDPALNEFNASLIELHPSLTGEVERHTYGEAYFSAMAYLMADPVRDEHELVMLELRVISAAESRGGPPSSNFSEADPAVVDLEISVRGVGPIVHSARAIPPFSSSAEIERITSEFVDGVIADLSAHARRVAQVLEATSPQPE